MLLKHWNWSAGTICRAIACTSATEYEPWAEKDEASRTEDRLARSASFFSLASRSASSLSSAACFFDLASLAAWMRAVSSADFFAAASAADAWASACCVSEAVWTWACWPAGMSASSVVSAAAASKLLSSTAGVLPDATPTTAPTVVTAVADATANPRTEIRLTRCPSSIVRLGDLADAIVPLALASLLLGSREGTGPVGDSPEGAPRGARGRHTDGGC